MNSLRRNTSTQAQSRCVPPRDRIMSAPREQTFCKKTSLIDRRCGARTCRENGLSEGFVGAHQVLLRADVHCLRHHDSGAFFLRAKALATLLGCTVSPNCLWA